MAQLNITRLYADNEVLFEADLDEISGDIETFMNVTRLNDDNIQDAGITASAKFVDGSVTSGLIESGSFTTSKLQDASVDTNALGALSITTAKIPDASLSGLIFATSSLAISKLTRDAGSLQESSAVDLTTSSLTYVNRGIALAPVGARSVLIFLKPNNDASLPKAGGIYLTRTLATTTQTEIGGSIQIIRTGAGPDVVIAQWDVKFQGHRTAATSTAWRFSIPPMTIIAKDDTAGGITYRLNCLVSNASTVMGVCGTLVAVELI